MLEALVQPLKDVDDEDPVVNWCTKVSQNIGHSLELVTVIIDQEVTLNKSAKSSIKVIPVLTVTEKLILDSEPEVARRAIAFSDHLVKIRRDEVADPVENDVVYLNPPLISGRSVIRDVVKQGIAL
jgi:hypothetical protein